MWSTVQGLAQIPATAQAQPAATAPAEPIRMAWINLDQAIFNVDEGKREFGRGQKYADQENVKIQDMQKGIESIASQLKDHGDKLTDDARAAIERQLEKRRIELQRFSQDTQKDIEYVRAHTSKRIKRKMLPVIEKISKERGYNAVLILNPSRDLYVDPTLIITYDVIRSYNQMYPGAAAKPATPAPKNQ
jgi:outer membrane protein